MNWQDKDFVGLFSNDAGVRLTPREAKAKLLEHLSKGHECLPIGACDGFNYHTGCPGHVIDNEMAA